MARINRNARIGSDTLSLAEARRIALHAQGFGAPRDGTPQARADAIAKIREWWGKNQ
jgi:uncharacterized protein YcaQ